MCCGGALGPMQFETMDMLQGVGQILDRWRPFRAMWDAYWLQAIAVRTNVGWNVMGCRLTGVFHRNRVPRSALVKGDCVFAVNQLIDSNRFETLLVRLAEKSILQMLDGYEARVSQPGRWNTCEWEDIWRSDTLGVHAAQGPVSYVLMAKWEEESSGLADTLKGSLDRFAETRGYANFSELSEAYMGSDVSKQRAFLSVELPLGLVLDDDEIVTGRIKVGFREPIEGRDIQVFISPDARWSDDLEPLRCYSDSKDPDELGWRWVRADVPKVLGNFQRPTVGVRYAGSPEIPKVLRRRLPFGRSLLQRIREFVYESSERASRSVLASGEELETGVLNSLAALGFIVFYGGDRGVQTPGVDLVAVDSRSRHIALIQVTDRKTGIDDKRRKLVQAMARFRDSVISQWGDWTVTPVFVWRGDTSALGPQDWSSFRGSGIALLGEDDLKQLGVLVASASDWWETVTRRARQHSVIEL